MVPVCALSLFQPRASLRCFDAASPVIAALLPLALLPLRLVVCVDPALPRSVAPICTRRSTCEGADTRATGRGVDSRERRAAVLCRPAAARPASGARACQQAVGAGQGAARIPGRRAGAPGLRRGSRLRAFRARGVAGPAEAGAGRCRAGQPGAPMPMGVGGPRAWARAAACARASGPRVSCARRLVRAVPDPSSAPAAAPGCPPSPVPPRR